MSNHFLGLNFEVLGRSEIPQSGQASSCWRSLTAAASRALASCFLALWFSLGQNASAQSLPTSGMKLRLDAGAGVTLYSGTSNILTWGDQSGVGNDASQSVSANSPTLSTNTLNGKPVVHFVGSSHQYVNLPNLLSGSSAAEVLVVTRAASATVNSGQWTFGSNSLGDCYSFSDGQVYNGFGCTSRYSQGAPSQDITQFHVYQVCSQAGSWRSWIDGVPFFNSATNTVGFSSAPLIGQNNEGNGFSGDIAEIVIYNRALSSAERQTALSYLTQKYALFPTPSTPNGLAAIQLSSSENLVSWDWLAANSQESFVIERKTGAGGTFAQLATVDGAGTYLDDGVTLGTEYYYRIYAVNANGASGYSSETAVSTPMAEGGSVPASGMKLWCMADGAVESPIGYWADYSGNGNDAWQNTYANRPTLSANTLNGKPVVHFVGSSHQYVNLPNLLSGASAAEVLVVSRATSATVNSGQWRFGSSSLGDCYSFSDGQVYNGFGSTGRYSQGAPSQDITQFHVYEVCSQAGSWQSWMDGVPFFNSAANTVGFSSAPLIGQNNEGNGFSGDIAEIIIYSRALSSAEREGVLSYFTQKYALLAAPATPTGLQAAALNEGSALITWNSPAANTPIYFAVWRQKNADSWVQVGTVANECTLVDSGLDPTAAYSYEVQAVNSSGASALTASVVLNQGLAAIENLPTNGMKLWLMADGVLESPVGYWADYSGYGNDAWQNTYANRPTLSANTLNGKPVVHFVGSSHQYFNLPNLLSGSSAAEVLVVTRAASVTVNSGQWTFGSSSLGDCYSYSDGQIYNGFGSSGRYSQGAPPQDITQFHVYEVCSQAGSWQSWMDGALIYASATNTVGFSTAPLLGENNEGTGFSGDIAEIVVYNRALMPQERDSWLQYFAIKYLLGNFDPTGDGLTTTQKLSLGLNPLSRYSNSGSSITDGTAISLGLNPLNPLTFYPNPSGPPSNPGLPPPSAGVPVITLITPAGLTLH